MDTEIRELKHIRSNINTRAEEERSRVKRERDPWGVYDSSLSSYLDSFSEVLPKGGLRKYLSQLSEKKGRKLRALDVAGQGNGLLGLKDSGVGSVAAITLVDFRKNLGKVVDLFKGLRVVSGDVSVGTTWSGLKEKFDLIVCRPVGAVEMLLDSVVVLAVFDKMYQKLEEDGVLLTQVPETVIRFQGTDWIRKLSETPGLAVIFDMGQKWLLDDSQLPELSIIKKRGAPTNLRFLKEIISNPERREPHIETKPD